MDANTMLAAITAALPPTGRYHYEKANQHFYPDLWGVWNEYQEELMFLADSEPHARLLAAMLNAAGPMCEAAAEMHIWGEDDPVYTRGLRDAVATLLTPLYDALVAAGAIAEVA